MRKAVLLALLLLALTCPTNAQEPPDTLKSHPEAQESRETLEPPAGTRESPDTLESPAEAQEVPDVLESPARAQEPLGALEILRLSIHEMERQDSLLAGYRYLKTVVIEDLDKNLSPKKSEERLVEVTSVPNGPDIEVVLAINGNPTSEKERQKERAEQEQGKSKEGGTQLELEAEDLTTLFEWTLAGHEPVNGRASTVLSFRPKPGAVYTGHDAKAEKFLTNVTGRAWVDDAEHVISRIEFNSMGPIKSLGGVLWTLHSFSMTEERKKLPDGVWMDSKGEYFVNASALFFKKIRKRTTMHTHGYTRGSASEEATTPASEDDRE